MAIQELAACPPYTPEGRAIVEPPDLIPPSSGWGPYKTPLLYKTQDLLQPLEGGDFPRSGALPLWNGLDPFL